MVTRITPSFVSGKVSNRTRNSVYGSLIVWGQTPDKTQAGVVSASGTSSEQSELSIDLTGNLPGNLAGREFTFSVPGIGDQVEGTAYPKSVYPHQIGAVGRCHLASISESSAERVVLRLEWYSQNGKMLLELIDPELEFLDDQQPPTPTPISELQSFDTEPWYSDEEELGDQSSHVVLPSASRDIRKYFEVLDQITMGIGEVPLKELIGWPANFPKVEELENEQQAWDALNSLLIFLARYGAKYIMCEHESAKSAYHHWTKYLLDEVMIHPQFAETGAVDNFDGWFHCKECQAEFDGDDDSDAEVCNGDSYEKGQ